MASLCYPYGSGITCVCDDGRIYKCFPDLKSDAGPPGGQGPGPGSGGHQGGLGDIQRSAMEDITGLDRR